VVLLLHEEQLALGPAERLSMRRPRAVLRALLLMGMILLGVSPARAAPSDPRDAEGRLEDAVVDGEIDAEDFFAARLGDGSLGAGRAAAYIGIEAFRIEKSGGIAEMGALLVIELPLERWGRPQGAALPVGYASFARDVDPLPAAGVGAMLAQTTLPRASTAAPAPSSTPIITVTTEVVRSCVRAALRAVGLGDDHRLDAVAARARSSAALPELRLRGVRTLGETGRLSQTSADDPSQYVGSGAATSLFEARLTFRLDRLLFADEELAVERVRLDRTELRARTTAKVLDALFAWQKAYALSQDPSLTADERFSAVLRELESSAILDIMTGGWFGAFRAALAARAP
jgi:hypothetical protein